MHGCALSELANGAEVVAGLTLIDTDILVGCRNKTELRALRQFLRRFRILKLSETISDRAVELLERYRLSHRLLIADALIAATALSWDCSLASKNQRDYRFIADRDLLPYP